MNDQHLPPHSLEAEEAVLGSMMIDSSTIQAVKRIISPIDFFITKHQWIYEAILALSERGDFVDSITIGHELDRAGRSIDKNPTAYLYHLESVVPTSIHAAGYAELIFKLSIKRQVLNFASHIAAESYNGSEPTDLILKSRAILNQISSRVIPVEEKTEQEVYIPSLPDDAAVEYDTSDGAGWFVDAYTSFASSVSPMSPVAFHQTAALWIGGLAIARRLRAAMHFDDVYPNLFVVWVAPSTVWYKTTALNVARRIIGHSFPHLLLSADITPQQLLFSMAGNEPANKLFLTERDVQLWTAGRDFAAQRGMCIDEISGMLSSAGRDYNAGFIEYIMRLYNCESPISRETKTDGYVCVRNAYLSMIGASTPMAVSPTMMNELMWSGGFWPRYIIITPDTSKPAWAEAQETPPPDDLINAVRNLYNNLPMPAWPDQVEAASVVIEPDAMSAWKRYYKACAYDMITPALGYQLNPLYGRLHIQALKAAMIMAALDWGCAERPSTSAPTVRLAHMARGIGFAEEWRHSAHRMIADVTMGESNRFLERVLSMIISAGNAGATVRDIYRPLGKTPIEVESALSQLVQAREVEVFEASSRRGGPRTKRYRRLIW